MDTDWQLSIDDALGPSLREAKDELRERLKAGESAVCPCCTQTAKIYTYTINHGMVQCLVSLARDGGWVHTPDDKFLSRYRGNLTKLQYWGLVERSASREENGVGSGYWRITTDGLQYLEGWQLPAKVSVFNGRVLGTSTELSRVSDAWGEPFNLWAMLDTPPEAGSIAP